ncbi:MAG: hypothetical protein QOF11_748 [Chloroflexota bacterium]|nr:hypothetical protein [Chloroflexota bacterium]
MPLYAIVLPVHIALAVALFLPSLLLPFALRTDRPATQSTSPFVRGLLRLQGGGSVVVGAGVAMTGALLVVGLGMTLLAQPWLLIALAIYALNLAIAFFIQRPNLRALVGLRTTWDDLAWKAAARRQRYVSYAMAALVGVIGYLMNVKPQL